MTCKFERVSENEWRIHDADKKYTLLLNISKIDGSRNMSISLWDGSRLVKEVHEEPAPLNMRKKFKDVYEQDDQVEDMLQDLSREVKKAEKIDLSETFKEIRKKMKIQNKT